jgi:recombination protein RecR
MALVRYPSAMRRLINELSKLPTVGVKSATRLAYHLVNGDERDAILLSESIKDCKEQIFLCSRCFFLAEEKLCELCQDNNRDSARICVVEKPADVIAIEKSGGFAGEYHVLHGLWSPLQGKDPTETKLPELLDRIKKAATTSSPVEEVVIATGTTVEGDATALYIGNAVAELGVKASRIAQGLPKGGELEFADEVTLTHALRGRRAL